jgi:c-di-GMP-binding flagellar brake protein YcgR
VAYTTRRGLHLAVSVVVGAEHSGLLELLVTAELERAQRRDHVRVAALLTGTVRPPHGDAPLHTYTLDVSGSGVLVAGAGPVTIGDGVGVTLKLPGDRLLEATGEVARRSRDGHVGLALAGLTHREREALVRFVFERQRHDLRAAREGLR